ncbi:MAG: hypothetical protein HY927_13510 [Elusimicrobia bacterium]|nr:hypothetical protein [Elusimicrobiota bacterium]
MRALHLAWLFLVSLAPATASWAGGLSVGVETNAVLAQDMTLVADPTLTLIETDNKTSLTTFRTMSYFRQVNYNADGSTTTTNRAWGNINNSSTYMFIKLGYATEYFEGSAKIGAANKTLTLKETTNRFEARNDLSRDTRSVSEGISMEMNHGFAYGFEVRGQPYDTESISVLVSLRFDQAVNQGDRERTTSITYSTMGAVLSQSSNESSFDISHLRYGLGVSAAFKFEHFVPFIGFDYIEGRFRVTQKDVTTSSVYSVAGALTTGTSTISQVDYTLKPKVPIGAMLGFTVPFERGGITIEGRLRGDSSLRFSAYVGF